jgi:hypothetical protein
VNTSPRPPTSKRRLFSGLAAGAFGLVVVALGGLGQRLLRW